MHEPENAASGKGSPGRAADGAADEEQGGTEFEGGFFVARSTGGGAESELGATDEESLFSPVLVAELMM